MLDSGFLSRTGEDPMTLRGGELNAGLTSAIVGIHSHFNGRGPRRSTTIHHGKVVTTVMFGTMTPAEHALTSAEHGLAVDGMRTLTQSTMESEMRAAVERLTERKVVACVHGHSAVYDVTTLVFILDNPV